LISSRDITINYFSYIDYNIKIQMLSKAAPLSLLVGAAYSVGLQSGMPTMTYLYQVSNQAMEANTDGDIFFAETSN